MSITGPTNGSWGRWQSWSGCSAVCGLGAKIRRRDCNNPAPAGGGNNCSGESEDWKICTGMQCEGSESQKSLDCEEF